MPDTKISALTAATAAAGANELAINEAGTSKKLTVTQLGEHLLQSIAGNSGAAGNFITLQYLTANALANALTVLVTVMTTTGVGVGVWRFRYTIIYQSAAITTGVGFAVNHTGTATKFVSHSQFVSTGGAAATGTADGVAAVVAGQLVEGKSERALNTMSSATAGVDTASADCLIEISGIIVVSASGSLELKHSSELAASTQVMANTTLELTKVA